MSAYALVFCAMFAHVMARAFQQLNVTLHRPRWVMPTSFVMACTEVLTVVTVVKTGFGWVVLPLALGGGLGCLAAMQLHQRMRHKDQPAVGSTPTQKTESWLTKLTAR